MFVDRNMVHTYDGGQDLSEFTFGVRTRLGFRCHRARAVGSLVDNGFVRPGYIDLGRLLHRATSLKTLRHEGALFPDHEQQVSVSVGYRQVATPNGSQRKTARLDGPCLPWLLHTAGVSDGSPIRPPLGRDAVLGEGRSAEVEARRAGQAGQPGGVGQAP
ncbi:hypothetical protein SSP24_64360 [Streptomyces spinoverrucosus]|uniref:Uncharacterized protein n=1 Tax=Streptomyces spinoverrucosus TaxID=284043 RepID=A0A4Y3VSL6_9ACTN|nr:hypothetical protein SSP24_64360 [Streptomyces spinoverrucosus]GHB88935.1 hypothetical protein GCM10010397_71130 [Streptomyces spinoverrucosus]